MKRSIHIFFALCLMFANTISSTAQTVNPSGDEDHNAYPLIIALIVLVIAIVTRLITVSQSRKHGNAI